MDESSGTSSVPVATYLTSVALSILGDTGFGCSNPAFLDLRAAALSLKFTIRCDGHSGVARSGPFGCHVTVPVGTTEGAVSAYWESPLWAAWGAPPAFRTIGPFGDT